MGILARKVLESFRSSVVPLKASFCFLIVFVVYILLKAFSFLCFCRFVCSSSDEKRTLSLALYARFQRFTTSTLPPRQILRHYGFAFLMKSDRRSVLVFLSVFYDTKRTKPLEFMPRTTSILSYAAFERDNG